MTQRLKLMAGMLALLVLLGPAAAQEPEGAGEEPVPVEAEPAEDGLAVDEPERIEVFDQPLSFLEEPLQDYWDRPLFTVGDTTWVAGDLIRGLISFALALVVVLVLPIALKLTVIRRLEKKAAQSSTGLDDGLLAAWRRTKGWIVLFFAVYVGLRTLPLPPSMAFVLDSLALLLALVQAAIWANAAFMTFVEKTQERRAAADPSAASAFGLFGFAGRVAIWSAVLLLALDNLGFDVTALIAGLGVGGIAVAFALQNILGDIFCSVAILLDKPFVVGDFIVVNDMTGTVERIGIKTTRVRSLSGEQIVFSNTDLLSSRIRNYKRMYERRVVFSLGVVYETPADKLERIPDMVREIIESKENTRFDRAHFQKFGAFSLDFEVVYYVLVPDYNVYMDIQQAVNLELFRQFEQEGIQFAYPTQELILRPEPQEQSA